MPQKEPCDEGAKRLDCGGFSTTLLGVPILRTAQTAALKTP